MLLGHAYMFCGKKTRVHSYRVAATNNTFTSFIDGLPTKAITTSPFNAKRLVSGRGMASYITAAVVVVLELLLAMATLLMLLLLLFSLA